VVLMDARHPMTPNDEQLIDWLGTFGLRQLAVLTKSDKLSRAQATAALKSARQQLGTGEAMLLSSTSGDGVEGLRRLLWEWVAAGDAATGNKRPPA